MMRKARANGAWRELDEVEADADADEADKRAAGEQREAVLDAWERWVKSGRMDGFACSPMAPPRTSA